MGTDKKWYVLHTYSGYENKVKTTLELKVQAMGMEDVISRILIPMEDEIDEKDGVKKVVKRKVFTGFVGSVTKPVPLSDSEVAYILKSQGLDQEPVQTLDVEVGETVRITSGAFEDRTGVITEINHDHAKLRLNVEMFNRETPVEVEYSQVEKIL